MASHVPIYDHGDTYHGDGTKYENDIQDQHCLGYRIPKPTVSNKRDSRRRGAGGRLITNGRRMRLQLPKLMNGLDGGR